ncbi:MAG TPA: nuclear transport factor 2 family protein [Caulobacteraceae bacterium]|nr:nuclear transport factor 2 family protein [Caulobacteraceae bacterium]
MTAAEDKRAIKAVIEARAEALRSKDVKALARTGSRDIVVYSLAPPLVSTGGLDGVRAWFATWDGPMGYETRDLEVTAGDKAAFAHCLAHMTGRRTDGGETDLWFRLTLGLEKRGGAWKITHEHHSTPFEMDGGFRAAVDLKP